MGVATGSAIALNDSTGATNVATISTYTSGNNPFDAGGTVVSANDALNEGGIYGAPSLTLTGIPYAQYSVYVYTILDHGGSNYSVTVTPTSGSGGGTLFGTTTSPGTAGCLDGTGTFTYVAGTGATNTTYTTLSNYTVFTGLTASSFTASAANGSGFNAAMDAVEIVQTPEPASLGLIAVAAMGLLARRRRI